MSTYNCDRIKDYATAFSCFKERFLDAGKSIFDLSNTETSDVLKEENINYLIEHFIKQGYSGSANSIEKFCYQLTKEHYKETEDEISIDGKKVKQKYFYKDKLTDVQKGAIEILATAIWLWRLPPYNTNDKGRMEKVYEILGLLEKYKDLNIDASSVQESEKMVKHSYKDNKFLTSVGKGFASPGMRYNMNKSNELAYIIRFFEKVLKEPKEKYSDIIIKLSETLKPVTTHKYDVNIGKDRKRTFSSPPIAFKIEGEEASISVRNGLLYLLEPGEYEAILSERHKKAIVETFKDEITSQDNEKSIDEKLKIIKINLIEKLGKKYKLDGNFFYQRGIKELWLSALDFKSNTILHGAPGTGKTYMAEEAIKIKQNLEKNLEYKLVQFHPSYTYEDFMDGIKPIGVDPDSQQMIFKLKNGLFKQMCIDAFTELKNNPTNPKKFYFIADEINRAELSRVFGELLLCLEEDKRLKIRIEDGVQYLEGTKVQTQNSMMWKDKDDVVVTVDDEGKILETSSDKKFWYFGVPENLYFIGTMNDIDRSVDSFDMALRRRFIWKHYTCDYDVIMEKYKADKNIENYLDICEALNKYITSNEGFNLGSSYELGHSYFMKPDDKKPLTQTNLNTVWDENIVPLLKEYIRAVESDENKIQKQINKAKKVFKLQ